MEEIENKYVAFCDILGFSNSVTNEFDSLITGYKEFRDEINKYDFLKVKISIYSDSIIIVSDNLMHIAEALQILLMTLLRYNWIVRGGIAYGKHWKESDNNNLYVVSEALVKAVNIEKTIKHPIIVVSSEIDLGLEYWIHGSTRRVFDLPIIHYNDLNIVNPFNNYWFLSAQTRLLKLKEEHMEHAHKYDYLLELAEAINDSRTFVPDTIIQFLLKEGAIKKND